MSMREFINRTSNTAAAVVFVFFLMACTSAKKETEPTYKPYLSYFEKPGDSLIASLRQKFDALEKVSLQVLMTFDSSWNFELGDKAEVFRQSPKKIKGVVVDLPHRLQKPDQAFWYTKNIMIDQPGILTIYADDGAQLFINNKPVHRLSGNHFPVDTTGSISITIRVLNNAMAGGLRKVVFSTREQFEEYQNKKQFQNRQENVVEKVSLLQSPSAALIELVTKAIESTDETLLMSAEKALEDFPFLIGPWLQRKDSSTFVISVESEGSSIVRLTYGIKEEDLREEQTKQGGVVSFELKDLLPDTAYYYRFSSGKTISPVYSFKTHQRADSFTFNVWADSQSGWDGFQENVRNMESFDDAFGVAAGDLVSNGSNPDEWRRFFKILSATASGKPYYLVPGNHDYDGYYDDLDPANYKKYLRQDHYFNWTYGNCAFIALDPNENFPIGFPATSEQYQWFHQQLESSEWKNATWRFIVLHQPPISQGWAGYQGDAVVRALLEPVMESAGIDFVIAGHTHDYERLTKSYGNQKTTFLIVGGAGGSLEPPESSVEPKMDTVIKAHHMGRFYVKSNTIRFEAIDLDKQLIDSFEQRK